MNEFTKMSGAGNDFIVVDNRDSSLDHALNRENIQRMCTRGLSVGADGLLELRSERDAVFRMKYYNPDGRPATMCGNGGRCIAAFAVNLGLAGIGEIVEFVSDAGRHRAIMEPDGSVRLWMTEPSIAYLQRPLELPSRTLSVSLADTGVPHAVAFTDDISDPVFTGLAPLVRSHPGFLPHGVNSTFARVESRTRATMRTWERGVEGETLSCGTGAVALALTGNELGILDLPVTIRVRSGLDMLVGKDSSGWWLQGEARTVYNGTICELWSDA